MPALFISVILPTYDRNDALCKTLTQLLRQNYERYEIVVVDQTARHTPQTEAFLMSLSKRIRYFRLRTPGLPEARNFGLERAQGEVVLFCDDDVELPPGWVASHALNYSEPTVGGVAGRVIEDGEPIVDTTRIGQVTLCGRLVVNHSSPRRADVEWARGGNMSFRRALVKSIGGFDPRFGGNAGFEEIDLCFRLRRTGYRIVFDPQAALVHLHLDRGGCQTRTFDTVTYYCHFLRNKTLFYLKNMPRYGLPCFLSMQMLRIVRTAVLDSRSWAATVRLLRATYEGAALYAAGARR